MPSKGTSPDATEPPPKPESTDPGQPSRRCAPTLKAPATPCRNRDRLRRPPGESGPEPLLEQRGQLTLAGEPLLLLLAEDERAVQRHLEDPFGPRLQLHPGDDRGIAVEDVGRRTDGPVKIVSGNAELDGQPVLVIQHLSLVVPEDRPTTSV